MPMVAFPQGTAYSHDGSAILMGVPQWTLAVIPWFFLILVAGAEIAILKLVTKAAHAGGNTIYQLLSLQPVADEGSWELRL